MSKLNDKISNISLRKNLGSRKDINNRAKTCLDLRDYNL